MCYSYFNNPHAKAFILDVLKNYDSFTRGDLQGTVEAFAEQHGFDSDDLLKTIDVCYHSGVI